MPEDESCIYCFKKKIIIWICEIMCLCFIDGQVFPDVTTHIDLCLYIFMGFFCLDGSFSASLPLKVNAWFDGILQNN